MIMRFHCRTCLERFIPSQFNHATSQCLKCRRDQRIADAMKVVFEEEIKNKAAEEMVR